MAKTKGALFSEKARGTIADFLTYQGRTGFRHAHKKLTRKDKNTTPQQHKRLVFGFGVAGWQELNAEEKAYYASLAKSYNNNPGFNIYLTRFLLRGRWWAKFSWAKFGATAKFGGP